MGATHAQLSGSRSMLSLAVWSFSYRVMRRSRKQGEQKRVTGMTGVYAEGTASGSPGEQAG